jgi:uncharacterized membrane protein YjjP (DUF1212 family)
MNDQELQKKIDELSEKLDKVYISSEKMRKYFMWMLIGTAALFILPLIGLLFAIPSFLSPYSAIGNI